jgi:hypothetical protein
MYSIQSLLLSRHSVGNESEEDATQSEETDETDKEIGVFNVCCWV